MADEIEIPRGVAVSRRAGSPPWQVEAAAGHASIHVVVRGSFRVAAAELGPGDVVLLRGAAIPRIECVAPEVGELLSAIYAAPGERLAAAPEVARLSADRVRRARGLSAIVGLLRSALADPSPGQEALARSLLDPLFAYVVDALERGAAAHVADRRVARALQLLRSRPAERWTVEALAKAAGLSRAAFARRFQEELGVPPLRYLADLRMRLAERLLVEGDGSLAAIAAEIGYESEFAFSRAFKRRTGEAPGVYRRRRRAEAITCRASSIRAAA